MYIGVSLLIATAAHFLFRYGVIPDTLASWKASIPMNAASAMETEMIQVYQNYKLISSEEIDTVGNSNYVE